MMRTLFALVLPVMLLAIAGCGPATTTVAGKVTYQGKTVVWGSVTLIASDGTVHQVGIGTDGTYTLPKVPLGSAKVGVESSAPPTGRTGERGDARGSVAPPPPPPGAWFAIPVTLSDPMKSGVVLDIRSGLPADIELK